jgi:hypothetical protein
LGFEEPRKRGGKKKEIGCGGGGGGRDLEERVILLIWGCFLCFQVVLQDGSRAASSSWSSDFGL